MSISQGKHPFFCLLLGFLYLSRPSWHLCLPSSRVQLASWKASVQFGPHLELDRVHYRPAARQWYRLFSLQMEMAVKTAAKPGTEIKRLLKTKQQSCTKRGVVCIGDESEPSPIGEEQPEYEIGAEHLALVWLCQKQIDNINAPISHKPFRVRGICPRTRIKTKLCKRNRESSRMSREEMWTELHFSTVPFMLADLHNFFLLHLRSALHTPGLGKNL